MLQFQSFEVINLLIFMSVYITLRCSMVVSRGDLEAHLKGACPLRHYSCPDCGKSGTHHYITTEHQQQCPEAVVPCPNGCGFVPITRRLEANHCKVCPNQVCRKFQIVYICNNFVGHCLATKTFIGKLPATRGVWLIIV